MTGRDLMDSFDWESIEDDLGDDVDLDEPPPSRVGATLVAMRLKAKRRDEVRLDLDADELIQSAVLPLLVMRRRLLETTAQLPLQALDGAVERYAFMAKRAEDRGDVAGADAWRTVVEAIDVAKAAAAKAVAQQTWDVDE